jgi:hypothetical protein
MKMQLPHPDRLPPGGHQTWNVCPSWGHTWVDPVPTPGVVHRTTLCAICRTHPTPPDGVPSPSGGALAGAIPRPPPEARASRPRGRARRAARS